MASALVKKNGQNLREAKAYELVSLGVQISRNVNPGNHVPCCNMFVLIKCFIIP